MDHEEKLILSDLNLAEFIREMARWDPAAEIVEHDGMLVTKTAGPSPVTNVAICLGTGDGRSYGDAIDHLYRFYGERKSGFSIHVRGHCDAGLDEICRSKGMHGIANAPGMVIENSLPERPVPDGVEIRAARDGAGVSDFAAVMIDSYQSLGMPAAIGSMIFARPERCIAPYTHLVVAYINGEPVSAAMALLSHSIAGIYWVGTVRAARGKGLAEACIRSAVNEAFGRGAGMVVLQASTFGEPIYRRLGFAEITRYPWYMFFAQ